MFLFLFNKQLTLRVSCKDLLLFYKCTTVHVLYDY